MSKYRLRELDRSDKDDVNIWKNFLEEANGATIFHDPDFLSYHGDRFFELHLGIFRGGAIVGAISLALVNENNICIAKSPYGASYGGFIFKKTLRYCEAKEVIDLFIACLKAKNVEAVTMTFPPASCFSNHDDTLFFSLMERGFYFSNSDITSIKELKKSNIEDFSSNAKRAYKKAGDKLKIVIDSSLDDFWSLVEKTHAKHGVSSTHSRKEFTYLMSKFPRSILPYVTYYNDIPVSAVGVFEVSKNMNMAFYICGDENYRELNAQFFLIAYLLDKSYVDGKSYFDFGTSSVNMVGRENIFRFKEGFGASGFFRHTLLLSGL